MIITELISGVLQVLVFSLIPFIVYLIRNKQSKGFLQYIGLHSTTKTAIGLALLTSILFVAGGLCAVLLDEDIKNQLNNPPAIQGELRQMGLNSSSIIILLITAWIKTSLSEEILFRGFIAKRLMSSMGFMKGNLLQSAIFALLHVILFYVLAHASGSFLLFIFLLSGIAAYVIGYIKDKKGNGSIIPGWIAHGLGNTISYYIIAYMI